MKKQNLNQGWNLTLIPHADVVKQRFSPTHTGKPEVSDFLTVPAAVPGCMELDLYAAGLTPDPYFGENPLSYRQYENRHLYYATTFDCEKSMIKNSFLIFEGIDTVSEIFLNGERIGETENMFIPHEFAVSKYLKEKDNELIVHIKPAVIEARKYPLTPLNRAQHYNHGSLALRKAAYMYGWDIMPRFLSGGIWKSVYLMQKPEEYLAQCYLYTTKVNVEQGSAKISAFFEIVTDADDLSDLRISIEGKCGTSYFYKEKIPFHTFENCRCG